MHMQYMYCSCELTITTTTPALQLVDILAQQLFRPHSKVSSPHVNSGCLKQLQHHVTIVNKYHRVSQ